MKSHDRFFSALGLTTVLMTASMPTWAETAPAPVPHSRPSYGTLVGDKLVRSLGNISTAFFEIPKGVINTVNESYDNPYSNVGFGAAGGTILGIINMTGRVVVGTIDLLTLPYPTQPVVTPLYPWQDFDGKTEFGKIFQPVE